MAYVINFAPRAARQLKKLVENVPKSIANEIKNQIDALGINPRPANSKKLEDSEKIYRVDVRDYRIVYAIKSKELIVLILKIAHRKEVYSKKLR